MLNTIDDGIWCRQCKKFHPTLLWHRKYDVEDSEEGIIRKLKKQAKEHPGMFGLADKGDDERKMILDEIIRKNLEIRHIADAEAEQCIVCGCLTSFISRQTGHHVCSDECLYVENGWKYESTGETIVFT